MTPGTLRVLALVAVLAWSAAVTETSQSSSTFAVRFQPGTAWDKSKASGDQIGFKSHSANLQRLRAEGRIVLGGRFADLGLIVVTAPDLAAARELFAGDETVAAKVFTIQIDPWSTIFDGCTQR